MPLVFVTAKGCGTFTFIGQMTKLCFYCEGQGNVSQLADSPLHEPLNDEEVLTADGEEEETALQVSSKQ